MAGEHDMLLGGVSAEYGAYAHYLQSDEAEFDTTIAKYNYASNEPGLVEFD